MSADPETADTPDDRFRGRRWRRVPVVLLGAVAFALVLRLTVRDEVPLVSTLYYASPPAVIAAGTVVAALLSILQRRRRLALVCGGIAAVTVAWFVSVSFGPGTRTGGVGRAIRAVVWNVQHGDRGWDAVARHLRALDADLICLVESGDRRWPEAGFFETRFADYDLQRTKGGFVVFARGRVRFREWHQLEHPGRAVIVDVTVNGADLTLIPIDILSNPLRDRRESFAMARGLAEAADDVPCLVLGDFNTPRDSASLDAWRESGLREAFEEAGTGYDPTWPLYAPVLTLDQVWGNRHVDFLRCERSWRHASDHRAVVFEFRVH